MALASPLSEMVVHQMRLRIAVRLNIVTQIHLTRSKFAFGQLSPKQLIAKPYAVGVDDISFAIGCDLLNFPSVASFILLADIGDQHLRALHLDFEGGNQRIFCVCTCALPLSCSKRSTIQLGGATHDMPKPATATALSSRLMTSVKSII